MDRPRFVYVTYIATTAEKLWAALTDGEFTEQYWFGTRIESTWEPGAPVTHRHGDQVTTAGDVIESDPPRRLSYSWRVNHEAMRDEPESRVTFTLEPVGGRIRLTLIHDQFAPGSLVLAGVARGWPALLSDLKTLMETGAPSGATVKRENPPVLPPVDADDPEPAFVYSVYIKASPEQVWRALVVPDGGSDSVMAALIADPPNRLKLSRRVEDVTALHEKPEATIEYLIEPLDAVSRLTVREFHEPPNADGIGEGASQDWPAIFSSLKTLLETGSALA
jgi:uncharacterized protein YndB with AHSA1/START domain